MHILTVVHLLTRQSQMNLEMVVESLEDAVADSGVRTSSQQVMYLRKKLLPCPPRLEELDSKVLDVFVFTSNVLDVLGFNSIARLRLLSF